MKMKPIVKDLLILVIPVVILLLLTPLLPEQISIHRGLSGNHQYIDRKYAFILGFLPFVIYKLKYNRK